MLLFGTAIVMSATGYSLGRMNSEETSKINVRQKPVVAVKAEKEWSSCIPSARAFLPTDVPVRTTSPEDLVDNERSAKRRRAKKHWHAGIIYFQKGRYEKSRKEWMLCTDYDPKNRDCQTGIARLDSTYSGGL